MLLPRLTFLTFHGLGEPLPHVPSDERPYWVPVATLRETLGVLGGMRLPAGMEVRLNFDDGNASDLADAVPLLLAHRRSAEFFVLSGRLGSRGSLAARDLREMHALGFAIGSHGIDHLRWAELGDDALRRELRRSRTVLEDSLGQEIRSAATPFGSVDARVVREAKAAGYRRIHTSFGGFTWSEAGLVPRLSVRAGFEPRRDLPSIINRQIQLRSAARDCLRRLKRETAIGATLLNG